MSDFAANVNGGEAPAHLSPMPPAGAVAAAACDSAVARAEREGAVHSVVPRRKRQARSNHSGCVQPACLAGSRATQAPNGRAPANKRACRRSTRVDTGADGLPENTEALQHASDVPKPTASPAAPPTPAQTQPAQARVGIASADSESGGTASAPRPEQRHAAPAAADYAEAQAEAHKYVGVHLNTPCATVFMHSLCTLPAAVLTA
jgi:hypothetical protein